MQELESLEAMLSYTSPQPPATSVPIISASIGNVTSVEDFDFAQFGVPMSAEQVKFMLEILSVKGKFRRSGVPTRALLLRRISKLCNLSRVDPN